MAMQTTPFLILTLFPPSLLILCLGLRFWYALVRITMYHWAYIAKEEELDLHTPSVPPGWKAVDDAELLFLWIPFHLDVWKSRVLR